MATRADNKDGSLTEILTGKHKGKWRVQFTQVDELGKKQRLSRVFPKWTDGKNFLQGLRHGVKVEAARSKKELTLGGWFDWLAENEWPEELAESTIANRKSRFNGHVRETWGGVPLLKIDALKVRAFYRSLADKGVGKPTVLEIKRDLVRVFNQAKSPFQRVPLSAGNPFALTVQTPPKREAVALNPEVAVKALASVDLDCERRAMLGIFLLAGLRLSEQMALTKGQILFDQDLIYVDRSVKFGATGKQTIGLPKGDKKRLVVMCPELKKLLTELTLKMTDNEVVWPAATLNQPRMKKLVYATWRTIVRDTKLPEDMSPHDCRLTHINWIEKLMPEVSPTTLKEHVGHATQGVTETNYTRPLTAAQKILRDNIERVAGKPKQKRSKRSSPN